MDMISITVQKVQLTLAEICLGDCRCEAFSYRLTGEQLCFTKSALFNGIRTPDFPGSIFLKLPTSLETTEPNSTLIGTNPICGIHESEIVIGSPSMFDNNSKRPTWVYLYSFVSAIGAVEVLIFVLGWWFLFRGHGVPASPEDGYLALSSQFRKFNYAELRKVTKKFREELGRGASGAIYKGILADERVVAVKRLGDMYKGEEVF
jgi:hypothetical protein